MTKKEAIKIVLNEVETNLFDKEGDESYDELREAVKVLNKISDK